MTKEDYDQIDPKEMELMDIRWCMASVILRAQRFMEITGRKCLEGPDMKIGFDKNKVTCFKCKQKGHFKRECSNNKADDSVNPFHDDYYKKANYHQNDEQPTRKQLDEGSSKEKKHALLTNRDRSESNILQDKKFNWDDYIKVDDNRCIIHDDEGYDWSKHDKEDIEVKAMVAEIKQSREERHARMRLDDMYGAYKEATGANRWSEEKECFVDPNRNPTVDPNKVDFKALVAMIPTVRVWCKGLEEIPRYREKVEEGIRKVIFASVEKKKKKKKKKKKTVEEIVDESQKLVDEVKKADEKAEELLLRNNRCLKKNRIRRRKKSQCQQLR
ncbi:putative transcription factor interactor and regulator CCHC(Zn) family [Helianthus debilis subsp. tardiflorus]